MHARARRMTYTWATVAVALFAWLMVALGVNASRSNDLSSARQHAAAQQHFYAVIARKEDPGTGVADQLATDLLVTRNAQLPFFRGNSNLFGGVTQTLGVDPFDNSCGFECGPLTPQMLANVRQAKRGGTVAVPAPKKRTLSETVPGLLLFLWALTGAGVTAWPYLARQQRQRSIEHAYPDEWRTLRELEGAMAALSPASSDYRELRGLRDGLQGALQMRVGGAPGDVVTEQRVDKLKAEARDKLAAMDAGNRVLES